MVVESVQGQQVPDARTAAADFFIANAKRRPLQGLKRRKRYTKASGRESRQHMPENSLFWQYLTDPATNELGTLLHSEFRNKFRIPKDMFDNILQRTRQSNLFPCELAYDQACPKPRGNKPYPLGMKILAVLRQLALGVPLDGVVDSARMGRSTLDTFYMQWIDWFVREYYDEWVSMPTTEEEIEKLEAIFKPLGLGGCVFSMDAVHIPHFRCESGLRTHYTGKEGYPTLVFNCHCSHNLRILYIGRAEPGARNDKTLVLTAVRRLREESPYRGPVHQLCFHPTKRGWK